MINQNSCHKYKHDHIEEKDGKYGTQKDSKEYREITDEAVSTAPWFALINVNEVIVASSEGPQSSNNKYNRDAPSDDGDDGYLSISGLAKHKDKLLEHEHSFCPHPAEWGNSEVENKNGHGSAHVFVFCAVNPNQEDQ